MPSISNIYLRHHYDSLKLCFYIEDLNCVIFSILGVLKFKSYFIYSIKFYKKWYFLKYLPLDIEQFHNLYNFVEKPVIKL